MRPYHALLALAAAAYAGGAAAQNLKPGLWEVNSTMKSSSGQVEKGLAQAEQQMAAMTPEQRKMMEEILTKHGVQMGRGAPGMMSSRMCLTREMADRNQLPAQQGDCKTTSQQRSGNTLKVAFTCTQPPSSGEGVYTIVSPEAYTLRMVVHSTVEGRHETMNMDGKGKWLGADCGDVKPLRSPAK